MKHFLKSTSMIVMLFCMVCMSGWSQNADGEKTPLLEIPSSATVEQWYANYYYTESYSREINRPVQVATDGNDIYVKGVTELFPDSWIKGTINGSKVCFPGGTYMGYGSVFGCDITIYGIVNKEYTDLMADYFASEGKLVFSQELTLHSSEYGRMALLHDVVLTRDMQPLTGSPVNTLPYIADLSSPQTFMQFAPICSDSESLGWEWYSEGAGAQISYSLYISGTNTDDYLVSPAVYLEAGRPYVVSATAFAIDSWTGDGPVQFEILIGKEPTVESLTTVVLTSDQIAKADAIDYTADFTVAESGYYHFALHAVVSIDDKTLMVSQLSVDYGASPLSPDAVTGLNITPGEKGAKIATITFTTPVSTVDGTPLTDSDLDVCIYHDAELWKTIQARPGTQMTVFDDGFTTSKNYKVGIVCSLQELHGKKTFQKVYVGYDVPAMPSNFTIKEQGDHISLKWDKVGDVGANGGYVDPSQVSYEIWYGYVDVFYDKDVMVADNLLDTDSFEFAFDCESGEQSAIAFFLVPKNEAGEGDSAKYIGCVGTPYATPFDEDFSSIGHAYTWYDVRPDSGKAEMNIIYSSLEDNYALVINAEEYAQGSTLVSPKITMAGTSNAVLSTDLASDVEGASVKIYIETSDNRELVGEFTLTDDWVTYECNVSKYGDATYVRVRYVCDIPASGRVYIDNICIEDKMADGIEEPLLYPSKGDDSVIYNLNGIRMNKLQKGINIINGKKIVK